MAQKIKKPETPPRSDAYRLAEVLKMRRVENIGRKDGAAYYECELCLGKSANLEAEIDHAPHCPINRL